MVPLTLNLFLQNPRQRTFDFSISMKRWQGIKEYNFKQTRFKTSDKKYFEIFLYQNVSF